MTISVPTPAENGDGGNRRDCANDDDSRLRIFNFRFGVGLERFKRDTQNRDFNSQILLHPGHDFRPHPIYPIYRELLPADDGLLIVWYTLPMLRRVPLVFSPQPEGGFTVTSPIFPELVTEGDTLEEAYANVADALAAVIELYAEQSRPLPSGFELPSAGQMVWSDALVELS